MKLIFFFIKLLSVGRGFGGEEDMHVELQVSALVGRREGTIGLHWRSP